MTMLDSVRDAKRDAGGETRRGATLVLVLCATAALVGLVLGAAALAAGRARRADDALARAALRDAARTALARAAWALCADTNGVDHLGEDWAVASAEAAEAIGRAADGVFTTVEDDRGRLAFPACGEAALAHLLSEWTSPDEAAARGLAHDLLLWKRTLDETVAQSSAATGGAATNAVLCADEELFAAPIADPAAFSRALPFLTVFGDDGRINANTAPRETVVACILGAGGTPGGAEGVWRRLRTARRRGAVFGRTDPAEALKLLRGEGDVPTAEELDALQRLQPLLCVGSDRFRLASVARRGPVSVRVECVWDRASRRILRWAE